MINCVQMISFFPLKDMWQSGKKLKRAFSVEWLNHWTKLPDNAVNQN